MGGDTVALKAMGTRGQNRFNLSCVFWFCSSVICQYFFISPGVDTTLQCRFYLESVSYIDIKNKTKQTPASTTYYQAVLIFENELLCSENV